jgi:hypothetical protein
MERKTIMKRYFSILFLIIFIRPIFGQALSPYLNLPQSPISAGAGWIGAAIPMKDAAGFYFNPANLGFLSKENNLSLFVMPQKTKWVPKLFQM